MYFFVSITVKSSFSGNFAVMRGCLVFWHGFCIFYCEFVFDIIVNLGDFAVMRGCLVFMHKIGVFVK